MAATQSIEIEMVCIRKKTPPVPTPGRARASKLLSIPECTRIILETLNKNARGEEISRIGWALLNLKLDNINKTPAAKWETYALLAFHARSMDGKVFKNNFLQIYYYDRNRITVAA